MGAGFCIGGSAEDGNVTLRASLSDTFLQGCRKPVLGVWGSVCVEVSNIC